MCSGQSKKYATKTAKMCNLVAKNVKKREKILFELIF
jgi:hypothetical protein